MPFDTNVIQTLILLLAVLVLSWFVYRPFNRHRVNIKKSKRVLKKVNSFQHQGAVINYLKKIDPFVFEEVLLTAFKARGFKVYRNKRYTGDGGIDGKIRDPNGSLILIQAKRYRDHIKMMHVKAFSQLVKNHKAEQGYFIHTGKTNGEIKALIKSQSDVTLFSGDKLVSLVATPGTVLYNSIN